MPEKPEAAKTGMWDEMKEIKRQQEEDWKNQPNFKFRKVDDTAPSQDVDKGHFQKGGSP